MIETQRALHAAFERRNGTRYDTRHPWELRGGSFGWLASIREARGWLKTERDGWRRFRLIQRAIYAAEAATMDRMAWEAAGFRLP